MRRYDICPLKGAKTQLVVVLQHDATDHLATCIVAPLVSKFVSEATEKVRITIEVGGKHMQLQTDRLAAVSRKSIGPPVASAVEWQDGISGALDRLFIGF